MKKIAGGGAVLPLFLLVAGFFLIKKLLSGGGIVTQLFGTTDAEKHEDLTKDVIASIPVDVNKLSFDQKTAKIFAERLQKAMNPISGFSPDYDGTDEEAILDIFKQIKNREDARLVYKSFGLREYTTNWFLDNQAIDLVAWIKNELSGSDLSSISSKLNWMQ